MVDLLRPDPLGDLAQGDQPPLDAAKDAAEGAAASVGAAPAGSVGAAPAGSGGRPVRPHVPYAGEADLWQPVRAGADTGPDRTRGYGTGGAGQPAARHRRQDAQGW